MTKEQEESLRFYTINSYLAINNLMYGEIAKAFSGALNSSNDAKGVLLEAKQVGIKERFGLDTLDAIDRYNQYKKRTFDENKIDEIKRILNLTIEDIQNIQNCMNPLDEDIILYRNIPIKKYSNFVEKQIILMKSFVSTSLYPHNNSYRDGNEFIQIRFIVPKGIPAIRYDKLLLHNEPDEVLLHPIKWQILNIENSNNKNCKKIINAKVIETLAIDIDKIKKQTKNFIKLKQDTLTK